MVTNSGFWTDGLEGTANRLNASLLQRDTFANRPAAGMEGRLYVATDGAYNGLMYMDTGTTWVQVTLSDQAVGTPSLRTLGTSATQAAAGDHQHTASTSTTNKYAASTATAGASLITTFPTGGHAINQTDLSVTPSGDEYTVGSYSWTPSTATNCFIHATFAPGGNVTHINSTSTVIGNNAHGQWIVTAKFKVDGSTQATITGVNVYTLASSMARYLYKTSNTSAKALTWDFSVTEAAWPTRVTDTDGSGDAIGDQHSGPTTTHYWSLCIFNQYSAVSYDEIVITV